MRLFIVLVDVFTKPIIMRNINLIINLITKFSKLLFRIVLVSHSKSQYNDNKEDDHHKFVLGVEFSFQLTQFPLHIYLLIDTLIDRLLKV